MSGKVLSTVAIVITVLVLVVGGVILAVYFVNKQAVGPVTLHGFSVMVNDEKYSADAGGLVFGKETKINIDVDGDYTVAVGVVVPAEDFSIGVGTEAWKWSELKTYDFTSCFDIIMSEKSFVIGYKDFATIISNAFGVNVDVVTCDAVPVGDIFELRVKYGDGVICLLFTLSDFTRHENPDSDEPDPDDKPGDKVTGVKLDITNIVF